MDVGEHVKCNGCLVCVCAKMFTSHCNDSLFVILLLARVRMANPSSEQQQHFGGSEGNEEEQHGSVVAGVKIFWSSLLDQKVGRESLVLYVADVKMVNLLEQFGGSGAGSGSGLGSGAGAGAGGSRVTRKQRSSWCNKPTPPAED